MPAPFLLALMGPTASGKSDLAEKLASEFDAQLIGADAFQIFRGMNVGTGKSENPERYELVDIRSPDQAFGVGEYIREILPILDRCFNKKQNVIVVGGTGLYIRAVFEQYADLGVAPDPNLRESIAKLSLEERVAKLQKLAPGTADKIDLKNPVRVSRALERLETQSEAIKFEIPPFLRLKLALIPNVYESKAKIENRVQTMVHNGWVHEIETLLAAGYTTNDPGFRAIGYRTMAEVAAGTLELEEATATTIAETLRYAKRQRSWLRSEPSLNVIDPGIDPMRFCKDRLNTLHLL